MGKFIAGIIVGVLGIAVGAYVYIHNGYFDMRADQPVGRLEQVYMGSAMDRYAERHSPNVQSPVQPTEASLIEGVGIYKANCAGCHGGPDRPISAIGAAFSPPAPQFVQEAPDMADNQTYWIIKHGIKMTGMPAWDKLLSENQIWTVTAFLGQMGKLDQLSPAVQQSWKGAPEAAPSPASAAQPSPAMAPSPQHKHSH